MFLFTTISVWKLYMIFSHKKWSDKIKVTIERQAHPQKIHLNFELHVGFALNICGNFEFELKICNVL